MKKFVIAFAVAATTTVAFAGVGAHAARAQQLDRLSQKLNLSTTQRHEIEAITSADRDKNAELYSSVRTKRQEYRRLVAANDPRASEVKSQLQGMRDQLRAARKATRVEMLKVLTPEQRTQLQQMRTHRSAQ